MLVVLSQLERPVKAEGNVENWLMSLMLMAQKSLHGVIRTASMAIQDQSFQLLEFLGTFPAQVICFYYQCRLSTIVYMIVCSKLVYNLKLLLNILVI